MLIINNKTFLIYGFGLSGKSSFDFLIKNNKIKIFDDSKKNISKKYKKYSISKSILNNIIFDYIIISPGIDINNCSIKNFLNQNKNKLITELDIFYIAYANNKKIAVTGTNGKSTTCKLIYEILKKSKKDVRLVGNIGFPALSEKKISNKTIFVIEISSYQIEYSNYFKADISILLNLSPDHLERHRNFKSYTSVKLKLFQNQTSKGISIIKKNDNYIGTKLKKLKVNSKILKLSKNEIKYLIRKINNKTFKDEDNLNNLLFAHSVVKIFKVKTKTIVDVINYFKPLPYRRQIILNNEKLTIINDSKSTSFSSTINLLKTYKNIYWIMGGLKKKGDIFNLHKKFYKNINVYIYGSDRKIFYNLLRNKIKTKTSVTLEQSLKNLQLDLKKKNQKKTNIIFSPAAASFDQFKNFQNRGEKFNFLINKINFDLK